MSHAFGLFNILLHAKTITFYFAWPVRGYFVEKKIPKKILSFLIFFPKVSTIYFSKRAHFHRL